MPTLPPAAQAVVEALRLQPHPEGGFYRETFRSPVRLATPRGERSALTVIHYLLPAGAWSAFHRVEADEAWHHVSGDPLELHVLAPGGAHTVHRLDARLADGAVDHLVVPAGAWQAARPLGASHCLVSCTVAPGFEFEDFTLARPGELAALRPELAALFEALGTR
jgi:predicted cupin superfamily sugar epimerase